MALRLPRTSCWHSFQSYYFRRAWCSSGAISSTSSSPSLRLRSCTSSCGGRTLLLRCSRWWWTSTIIRVHSAWKSTTNCTTCEVGTVGRPGDLSRNSTVGESINKWLLRSSWKSHYYNIPICTRAPSNWVLLWGNTASLLRPLLNPNSPPHLALETGKAEEP